MADKTNFKMANYMVTRRREERMLGDQTLKKAMKIN